MKKFLHGLVGIIFALAFTGATAVPVGNSGLEKSVSTTSTSFSK